MKINNKFNIGDFVYLVTDPEQVKRMVTQIRVTPMGLVYLITYSDNGDSEHYELELSDTKDQLLSLS